MPPRQDDRAFALDARTGRPIWHVSAPTAVRHPSLLRTRQPRAGHSRQQSFLGHARRARHRTRREDRERHLGRSAADYRTGYSFTVAPLAVKNLIIIGCRGGEYGVRGFIDAYDADTGQRKWRFYTVPGPGEPGHDTWEGDSWKVGGAPAWNTGTYDPATESDFLADGKSRALESRRRTRRRQSLQQFPARARRRHGQTQLVFPVHQARRA